MASVENSYRIVAKQEEEKKKFIQEVSNFTQNNDNEWSTRVTFFKKKDKEWDKNGWSGSLSTNLECPKVFGLFEVSQWGGTGGCGFDIWFDENGKREKRWIDLNIIFNVITGVKMPGLFAGNDEPRNEILKTLQHSQKTPQCLITLFPTGYYLSEDAQEKVSVEPVAAAAGGGYKKRTHRRKNKSKTKHKKSKKSKKGRKSKRKGKY